MYTDLYTEHTRLCLVFAYMVANCLSTDYRNYRIGILNIKHFKELTPITCTFAKESELAPTNHSKSRKEESRTEPRGEENRKRFRNFRQICLRTLYFTCRILRPWLGCCYSRISTLYHVHINTDMRRPAQSKFIARSLLRKCQCDCTRNV